MREAKQYVCEVCGHEHNEAEQGWFEDLPKYANCPSCGTDAQDCYKLLD